MKRILWYILAIVFAVASCTGGKVSPRLVAIDSLIATEPDSACALLAAFPADSLAYGDNRPYHALLTTIADYKAYRPATSDSAISIALEHYDRSGADPDKRMRSLLYRGCVATELGNDTLAMRYYKLALQRCPTADRFHQGYIHFRIAGLYHDWLENRQSIGYYRNAYNILTAIGEQNYRLYSCSQLGCTYRSINADSAKHYITLGIELAKEFNQPYYLYQGYADLAGNYFNQKDYRHAIDWAMKAIKEGADELNTGDAHFFACQSYIELNKIDSAQSVLKLIPNLISARDSSIYYGCLAKLAEVKNEKDANKYAHIRDSIDDAISIGAMSNGLIAAEKNVDVEYSQQLSSNKLRMVVIAAFVLLIVAALLLCRYIHRQRLIRFSREADIDKLNREIEQSLAQLSQLRELQQQLMQTSTIQNKEVQHLQQQIDSLQQATDNGLGNIIKVLNGVVYDSTKNKAIKSDKLSKIMDNDFFDQLHIYINVRYDNLILKLRAPEFKLNDVDINTICLELCHMPNPVIWSYLGVKSLHSVITRKSLIASKVGGLTKIADIPQYINSKNISL